MKETLLKRIGWIGSVLLAVCSIPEVILAFKNGHVKGLTWEFLLLWYFGEIFILIPVLFKIKETFLTFNYLLNITLISILIYFKFLGG